MGREGQAVTWRSFGRNPREKSRSERGVEQQWSVFKTHTSPGSLSGARSLEREIVYLHTFHRVHTKYMVPTCGILQHETFLCAVRRIPHRGTDDWSTGELRVQVEPRDTA